MRDLILIAIGDINEKKIKITGINVYLLTTKKKKK
jgi:hypothetical protein